MAKPVRLITKKTAVPGRIPTGTTGTEASFIKQGELAINTADKKLFSYDGSEVFEIGSESYLGLTGGTVTGSVFIPILSATTYYGDGSQLSGISTDNFYTTGSTLIDSTLIFNRTDLLSAYTVDLSSIASSTTFSDLYLPLTGGTMTGSLYGTIISATTVSATTFYGDGSQLSGISADNFYTTGTTWDNNSTLSTILNNGDTIDTTINEFSGLTVTSLTSSGTSIVTANSGGTITGGTQYIISAYIISGNTAANLLEDINNWNINAEYTGTTITGTYQGQKHYNPSYFFEAVEDNLFIRFLRG